MKPTESTKARRSGSPGADIQAELRASWIKFCARLNEMQKRLSDLKEEKHMKN